MTVPVVISVSTGVNVGQIDTLTFSHTVAAGTDRFLTVAITFYNAGNEVVSTVEFNSVGLTFIGTDERPDVRTELWRLVNPDVGTFDVDIVLDAPLSHDSAPLFGAAIDYTGVHQTTPLGTIATADGDDANPTVNVSSGTDELVVDCVGSNIGGGTTQTVGSGQTERYNPGVQGSGGRRTLPGGSTEPGPGTVTMDWALDDAGPQSEPWAIVAASIMPATVVVVPPTVDAGGPYNGDVDTAIALDGTVTPGTDLTPVLLWTIFSGPGGGVFSNDAIEDPTFTPDTIGSYVLQLSADPNDGPAVTDTASLESDDVPPVVDAGGPYAGGVSTPIALNATVTPGSDPSPALLWTIDSGGTGTFSDDSIEDPTFTGDGIGPYVLRLTASVVDGPDVFDTAALTTAALADAVFLGGRLLRGGTGDLVMSQLSLGADPPGGDVVFIKGTAHSNAGAMYVAEDDSVVARVFIAGIAHQHNGVRLVTFNTPVVNLNAWGLDANGAQGVALSGAGQPHEGILLRGDGFMVVDGVVPPPIGPPALGELIHWYDFDDLSTLWQDIAGTIPVTTPGQNLARVDDKGSFGTDLIDASAGQFRTPMWGFSNGTGEYDSPVGGFNKVLTSSTSPGISGSELTMAWVADRDNADTGTANVATWMTVQGIQLDQFSGNNLQGFTNGVGVNGNFVSRSLLGAIFLHRFPDQMELRDSQNSGFLSAVNAVFTNPIANQDLSVGAESGGSGAEWRGIIKAVFIWNKALTAQEIQDFKDFTTSKFSLAWA